MDRKDISDFVDDTNDNGEFEPGNLWEKIEIKGNDSEIFSNF